MRNLSVVAMLLGISAACSNQPATTVSPPTEADSKPAAGAPPETGGFHHTAPVHAVAVVARGTDFRLLTYRQGQRKAPRNGGAEV
jgi:hypothetical protein